jgi:hypothetical protein
MRAFPAVLVFLLAMAPGRLADVDAFTTAGARPDMTTPSSETTCLTGAV